MPCFCTIVTRSYLPYARALAASLKTAGNAETLHVLVVDADSAELATTGTGFVCHGLDDLRGLYPPLMPYYFDAFELCNALKPFLIAALFRDGADAVVYLDADIYAVGSFAPVWQALTRHAVLLTPHQFSPPPLTFTHTNEIEIVDQGIFNGGFSAWRAGTAADRILDWMRERFPRYAFNDRRHGMFSDQKLLPFLPVYFPKDVEIWREPTVNIAFWNAHERNVARVAGRFAVGEAPVVFFHLSGFRPDRAQLPCAYLPPAANRGILEAAPWLSGVLEAYRQLLATFPAPPPQPYRYARLGAYRLSPGLRRILYREGALSARNPAVLCTVATDWMRQVKRRVLALVRSAR